MKKNNLRITVIDHEDGFIGPSCQRAFQKIGCTVQLLRLKGEEGTKILDFFDLTALLNEIIPFGPDLILDINGKACDRDGISLTAFRILNIPVFIWFVDNPLIPLNYGKYKYSHLFTKLVYDRFQCEEMKGLGISNIYHFPLGVDDDYFKPLHLEPSEEEKYKGDISFVGHSYADRCAILRNKVLRNRWPDMPAEMNDVIEYSVRELIKGTKKNTPQVLMEALEALHFIPVYPQSDLEWIINIIIEHESGRDYRADLIKQLLKYGIKIYGNRSWSMVLGDYNISPQVHYFNELPKVYNASLINLNISRTQLVTAVNQRVFDVPACKSFLITDFKEELEAYFVIGKEIICYKDQEDLCRLVSYYLANPTEIKRISEAGYDRAISEHTYARRMDRLIEIYKCMPEYNPVFESKGDAWEKANIFIAQAYLKLLNKDKAVYHFKRSLNRDSGSYIYNLNSAGVSLLQNKEYSECIPLFNEASAMDPEESSFLSNLGLCYQGLGQYEESENFYRKALKLDPSNAVADANLRDLYKKVKKDSEVIKSKPNNRNVNFPAISLCMIVKNEELNLSRCLNSVRGLINELIIADTGSTDRTVEIAKGYDAKILPFKWNDNFSDARNASIELAEGEWILILDADEVIAGSDIEALKRLCYSKEFDAFSFITRNYTNDSSGAIWVPNDNLYREGYGYAGWFPSGKVRLFKNNFGIRFSGVIHELAEHSVRELNLRIGEASIPVHHYGAAKSNPITRDKKTRYLDYCKKKIEEEPGNAKAYYEYGILCSGSGSHTDAVKSFKKVLELNPDFPFVAGLLGASLISLGYFKEAVTYLRRGIDKEPDNPGLYNNLASAYHELEEFDKAVEFYKKAITINPEYASGYKNLGVVYLKTSQREKAMDSFKKALSLNPSMEDIAGLIEEINNISLRTKVVDNEDHHKVKKSRLSLCMIVKDEEDVIKSCLESVRGITDEIIIVDTGSKDNTLNIASSYGATILQYEWSDNFSVPRNLSIQKAKGDYILWLDADEYISPESREKLLKLKDSLPEDKTEAYSVIIESIREDQDDESFRRLRIFPNRTGIEFTGRVHEDVSESVNKLGIKERPVDVVFIHKGYRNDQEVKNKIKRNIPILIKQHEDNPDDPVASFYLANSFYCLGDTIEAIKFMGEITEKSEVYLLKYEWIPFAFIKQAQFLRDTGQTDQIFKLYDKLFNLFPEFLLGHFFFGEILYFQGRYGDALKEFEYFSSDDIEVYGYPTPVRKVQYLKYYYSGCCYLELGRYKDAADSFLSAKEFKPDSINLHISLARLFAVTGDIISCVDLCNLILNDLKIARNQTVESIKELSCIFRTIGSSLEVISMPQEAGEAYKTALILNNLQ